MLWSEIGDFLVWYLFVLFGMLSGIIGSMGMGGGTVLIPFLTIFLSVGQTVAQGYNLLAFLPMAIIAIFIHLKNNLIKFDIHIFLLIIFGCIFSVIGAYFANFLDKEILKILFGSFLIFFSYVILNINIR